jgi:hypothetical protein
MIKFIILNTIFYICSFLAVIWYWGGADDSTKTGLFYLVFTIACAQNAYYGYKLLKIETANKLP